MTTAPRIYDSLLAEHLASNRQMAFFSGPRQVGKTTTCRLRADAYVNWDDLDDRELILAGPRNLVGGLGLDRLSETVPVVLFDELHKFPRWKRLAHASGALDAERRAPQTSSVMDSFHGLRAQSEGQPLTQARLPTSRRGVAVAAQAVQGPLDVLAGSRAIGAMVPAPARVDERTVVER